MLCEFVSFSEQVGFRWWLTETLWCKGLKMSTTPSRRPRYFLVIVEWVCAFWFDLWLLLSDWASLDFYWWWLREVLPVFTTWKYECVFRVFPRLRIRFRYNQQTYRVRLGFRKLKSIFWIGCIDFVSEITATTRRNSTCITVTQCIFADCPVCSVVSHCR